MYLFPTQFDLLLRNVIGGVGTTMSSRDCVSGITTPVDVGWFFCFSLFFLFDELPQGDLHKKNILWKKLLCDLRDLARVRE